MKVPNAERTYPTTFILGYSVLQAVSPSRRVVMQHGRLDEKVGLREC